MLKLVTDRVGILDFSATADQRPESLSNPCGSIQLLLADPGIVLAASERQKRFCVRRMRA